MGQAIYGVHLNSDGTSACAPVFLTAPIGTDSGIHTYAYNPSVAITSAGSALVAWTGNTWGGLGTFPEARSRAFDLDDLCSLTTATPPSGPSGGDNDQEISAAIAGSSSVLTWTRDHNSDPNPWGLVYAVTSEQQVRGCVLGCDPSDCVGEDICWVDRWQPVVAKRSDGRFLIAFADYEINEFGYFVFDIKLRGYEANGNPIGSEVMVNRAISTDYTAEESPAVAIDAPDEEGVSNVVVIWAGQQPDGCTARSHIFARRLNWDATTQPAFASDQFIVDTDSAYKPVSGATANPTVALTSDPNHRGRWVAAWNVIPNSGSPPIDIHAQFFEADGRPMGGEFRVNWEQETSAPYFSRGLANSAAHTISYHETVGCAWHRGTSSGGPISPLDVYFTLLPAGYAEYQESLAPGCLRGDVEPSGGDGDVDFNDIAPFIAVLIDGPPLGACSNIIDLCPYDMNIDGAVNGLDVDCFTETVLGQDCSPMTLRIMDCNGNQVPDHEDIENETSTDVNSNGIPDECEVDCNTNGVPDDWDVVQATSGDCNTNGVPDECEGGCNSNGVPDSCDVDPTDPDGNQQVSADCNQDGSPDECEQDCNTNGVPDTCDLDPTDPDGDEWVSPDCNGDNYPDECNLALPPPFGSSDCNTNEVPDECDIAACENDPACDDCNENGIPDSCDIAAEISEDVNTNGIPDECEGEGMMGGESMTAGEGGDQAEAWEAFYDWAAQQCWGPPCETTGAEQFAAMVAKLRELELPVTGRVIDAEQ